MKVAYFRSKSKAAKSLGGNLVANSEKLGGGIEQRLGGFYQLGDQKWLLIDLDDLTLSEYFNSQKLNELHNDGNNFINEIYVGPELSPDDLSAIRNQILDTNIGARIDLIYQLFL
jgi:hypothetical protein